MTAAPAPNTNLLDVQEQIKPQSSPPFPQPFGMSEKARLYQVQRVVLAVNEQQTIEVGFVPDYWMIYCRFGPDTAGYYANTASQGNTALWQRADKTLKLPGLVHTFIYVQSDGAALEMYVVAVKNCDVST